MTTTVIGGGEYGGDVRPGVGDDPVVVVGEPNPFFLALVGADDAQEVVALQEGLDGSIAKEVGAAARRVVHEVQLQELCGWRVCGGCGAMWGGGCHVGGGGGGVQRKI